MEHLKWGITWGKLLFATLLLLNSRTADAQDLGFQWGRGLQGFTVNYEHSIAADKKGNVYAVLAYSRLNRLLPKGDTFDLVIKGENTAWDMAILKFDRYGELKWIKSIQGKERITAKDIVLDDFGHVYITGAFYGAFDFDPGPDTFELANKSDTSNASFAQYILKLNSSGDFVWATAFRPHDLGGFCRGVGLAVDKNGDVYSTGLFRGYIDFDPGVDTAYYQHVSNIGSTKAFIAKLDNTGGLTWVRAIVAGNMWAMTLDQTGNVLITGTSPIKQIDFDPGPGFKYIKTERINGSQNCFVLKLSRKGDYLWAGGIDGAGSIGYDITCDPQNNLLLTGQFLQAVDFDFGSSTQLKSSNGGYDIFILKMDSIGRFQWVETFGGKAFDIGQALQVNERGDVYSCGYYGQDEDIEIGGRLFSSDKEDGFIYKLASNGKPLLVKNMATAIGDVVFSISLNRRGDVFTSGYINGILNSDSFDIDPGKREFNLPIDRDKWQRTTYIQKFSDCFDTSGTHVVEACDSFTWINGVTYYSDNNTAIDTIASSKGCDSVVSLQLKMRYSSKERVVKRHACDSLIWNNGITYYNTTDTARRVLSTKWGCDSVIRLDLTIYKSSSGTDVIRACDSIMWIDGKTYEAKNNEATYMIRTRKGCDSLVTLDFDIIKSSGTDNVVACDSLVWIDGKSYFTDNSSATQILENYQGCDSLVSLNLKIKASSFQKVQAEVCESYTWIDGQTYTQSGTAVYQLVNSVGCDSNIFLDLVILEAQSSVDTVIACGSYTWIDGNTYTEPNNLAQHVLTNSAGCDSTINLHLSFDDRVDIYPNPSKGLLNVHTAASEINYIRVMDLHGRVLLERTDVDANELPLKTRIPTGVYIVEIRTPCGHHLTKLLAL